MPSCVQDVKFPGASTKIIVVGETVFKVKYKMSDGSLQETLASSSFQTDLKKITSVILDHIINSNVLVPLKTDYMVVYPGCLPWSLVSADRLLFFHNGLNLRAHPEVVYLLVHVFARQPTETPVNKHLPATCLGKRPHPNDVQLPFSTGVPSTDVIIRKKLRFETEPLECDAGVQPQVPSSSSTAALPTERAQLSTSRCKSSSMKVSKVAMEMRSKLEILSKPNGIPTDGTLLEPPNGESIFSGIFKSVKALFGWS